MSEASRAHALAHAAIVHTGSGDAAATLETAEAFHAFMSADSDKPSPAKAPAKTPAKAPVKTKTPVKEVEEDEPEETAEEGDVTKEQVGEAIEALLNANLRDKVIKLYAKYKAKSLSSVKEDDYAAIKQDAEDLLIANS